MQEVNDLINYFKNITETKIVDITIASIVIILFWLLSSVFSYCVIKAFMKGKKDKEKIKSNGFYLPIKILFGCIGIYVAVYILELPVTVIEAWKKIFKIILICVIASGLVNVVDPKSDIAKKFRRKNYTNKDKTIANFTGRILKYIIYVSAGFLILTEFSFDVSGLVAGLGIGGAVIALAAQDFVKGLIAGMSILSDKPFLVGDWIELGVEQGTVIDISFRSTKIKTNNNTIVTLPNSMITSSTIVNWSRLKQRRYELDLKVPLETNSDVMDTIVNRIRFVLKEDKDILPETVQVNFTEISERGNNINIYMYTTITALEDYLHFKQVVNDKILKVLESENVKVSYPGQNIYMMNKEEDKIEE